MEDRPVIEAINITKRYDGKEVLKNINLTVKRGEIVLIRGPSGAGKTTLLNILGCMDTPTAGKLYIDGEDTGQMNQKQLANLRLHKIGFIFQEHNLIENLTVEENILLPMKLAHRKDAKERTRELMQTFGIEHIRHKKPGKISGGEKQRAAIARALANEPEVILADEPTASLDEGNFVTVLQMFRKINSEVGTTIVISSHEPVVGTYTDKKYVFKNGSLVEVENENI